MSIRISYNAGTCKDGRHAVWVRATDMNDRSGLFGMPVERSEIYAWCETAEEADDLVDELKPGSAWFRIAMIRHMEQGLPVPDPADYIDFAAIA